MVYEYPKGLAEQVTVAFGGATKEVYIADGVKPRSGIPTTLLISSPRGSGVLQDGAVKNIYDEFKKSAKSLYMPTPSVQEIQLMRKHCFPLEKEEDVAERVQRWGAVPRYVLAEVENENNELEIAIKKQNVNGLMRLLRTMDETVAVDNVSFRVVHYDVSSDFKQATFRWASPHVGRRVVQLLTEWQERDRLAVLGEMLKHKTWLGSCATLWEEWCNQRMAAGGTFKIRRLGTGAVKGDGKGKQNVSAHSTSDRMLGISLDAGGRGELVVCKAGLTGTLRRADQLGGTASASASTRWRAKACFAAADFIELGGVCSNATVSDVHDLLLQGRDIKNGLLPITRALHPAVAGNAVVPFLWLVPPLIFDSCRAGAAVVETQPELSAKATEAEHKARKEWNTAAADARKLAPNVVQYAVEIPLPETPTLN